MWSFGYKILANSVIETGYQHIYQVIIGRLFTPATLGFFDRGRALKDLPVVNLIAPAMGVFYPSLATVKGDADRLRKAFQRAIVIVACGICPIMFGLVATADILISVLYSDKWLPSVPYLQLLCPVGLFLGLRSLHHNLFKALGRPDLLLKVQTFRITFTIISILITYRWGLQAMLSGEILVAGCTFIIAMILTNRLIEYSFYRQVLDLIPYLMASVIMIIVVLTLGKLDFGYKFVTLILQIFTGGILYLIICRACNTPGYTEIQRLLSNIFDQIKPHKILKTV
jgi:O-antigen/teichoic acid export membrane protein